MWWICVLFGLWFLLLGEVSVGALVLSAAAAVSCGRVVLAACAAAAAVVADVMGVCFV